MIDKEEEDKGIAANSRICVLCNHVYSTSSDLFAHHQKSHSKKELSKALIHLQHLLTQVKLLKPIKNRRHDKKLGIDQCDQDSNFHFLYNCMEVNDVKVLLETSQFNTNDNPNVKNLDKHDDSIEVQTT